MLEPGDVLRSYLTLSLADAFGLDTIHTKTSPRNVTSLHSPVGFGFGPHAARPRDSSLRRFRTSQSLDVQLFWKAYSLSRIAMAFPDSDTPISRRLWEALSASELPELDAPVEDLGYR